MKIMNTCKPNLLTESACHAPSTVKKPRIDGMSSVRRNYEKRFSTKTVKLLMNSWSAEASRTLRKEENKFFISYAPRYKAVTSTTIARWVKEVMSNAGIDTKVFKSHATRSASTSAASTKGLSLLNINKAAGWSNAKTFAKHYNKKVLQNFGSKILKNFK